MNKTILILNLSFCTSNIATLLSVTDTLFNWNVCKITLDFTMHRLTWQNHEIIRMIVVSITVNVMNNFAFCEWTP